MKQAMRGYRYYTGTYKYHYHTVGRCLVCGDVSGGQSDPHLAHVLLFKNLIDCISLSPSYIRYYGTVPYGI